MFTIKSRAAGAILVWATGLFYVNFASAGIAIEHWTLPSGAQVYLVQSPAIPMLDVQIDFDAGGRRDPPHQAGLASVTAAMVEKGVGRTPATALDENALGEAWADLGAVFDASASSDRMAFSLRTLTYPDLLARATALAARQLGEPSFAAPVWARERERISAALKEANTRPATVAGRAFNEAVYGTHPYGFDMTPDTLAAIRVADMQALYARTILPCRAKVTLVGALDRAQADALVQQLLSRLPQPAPASACPTLPAVPEVQPLQAPQTRSIDFASAQAHVLLGQPGFKRSDPDFFALTVGNYILGGGGFASRLTDEVRQKRGLTYSVVSGFSPGLHAGAFAVSLQTRPDQAAQALHVVREVLARFVAQGPTAEELQAAKDNLIGGFPLRLDSNRKLLDNVANIAWNGLPLDYLDTWTGQINAITADQVRDAFGRKLRPEAMVTVVLGATPPID